ncbi:MAG: cytidylate kinase [Gammaproteobacteria bacterium]|nr:cytidylate kinase [Gammaproteobacteria bacterium]
MSDIPVIAIDGPSGSGKGTIAEMVANRLGFILLDSGALYRILGIAAHKANLELDNHNQVANLARTLEIEFCNAGTGTVLLNGEDVSKDIRTELGSSLASQVGSIPAAREALYERQLQFRKSPGLVADGRDMGTVIFPDATLKIFLTAVVSERAQRRYKQLIDKGIDATLPDLLRDLNERDRRDTERPVSPLKPAEDAVILDSTELSIEEVVEQILKLFAAESS